MKCRYCEKDKARYKDPVTKDYWHKRCHNKIIKLPPETGVDFKATHAVYGAKYKMGSSHSVLTPLMGGRCR